MAAVAIRGVEGSSRLTMKSDSPRVNQTSYVTTVSVPLEVEDPPSLDDARRAGGGSRNLSARCRGRDRAGGLGATADAAARGDDAEQGCDDDCECSDHDLHGVSLVGTPWMVDVLRNRPLAAG